MSLAERAADRRKPAVPHTSSGSHARRGPLHDAACHTCRLLRPLRGGSGATEGRERSTASILFRRATRPLSPGGPHIGRRMVPRRAVVSFLKSRGSGHGPPRLGPWKRPRSLAHRAIPRSCAGCDYAAGCCCPSASTLTTTRTVLATITVSRTTTESGHFVGSGTDQVHALHARNFCPPCPPDSGLVANTFPEEGSKACCPIARRTRTTTSRITRTRHTTKTVSRETGTKTVSVTTGEPCPTVGPAPPTTAGTPGRRPLGGAPSCRPPICPGNRPADRRPGVPCFCRSPPPSLRGHRRPHSGARASGLPL
ncbi:hypothetical protein DFJ74DRAFT_343437 [Hyaloraphidium curvatum]|nr:hypothetical protein DFJ74DRAFT_343437 [Hyaloraphidium curvatum]